MAPIPIRVRSAYKDIRIPSLNHRQRARARTHTHTHTHTHARARARAHDTGDSKKATDQFAEEERWVFSFVSKEESEDECLTERGREFQCTGPVKGSLPQSPSAHPRNMEDASIGG